MTPTSILVQPAMLKPAMLTTCSTSHRIPPISLWMTRGTYLKKCTIWRYTSKEEDEKEGQQQKALKFKYTQPLSFQVPKSKLRKILVSERRVLRSIFCPLNIGVHRRNECPKDKKKCLFQTLKLRKRG